MTASTYRCAYLLGKERVEIRETPLLRPRAGEILVRVDAATTCGTDVKVFRRGGHPTMLTPPCPFGHELAATITDLGDEVDGWSPGDRVVVANSASCGTCTQCLAGRENLCQRLCYLNGAFAERLLVPAVFVQRSLHRIPQRLPSRLAALAEPLACVLHGLDRMPLPSESEVMVLGGGPIGLMFAWLVKRAGHQVTLADPHPTRLQVAAELGAIPHQIEDRDALKSDRLGTFDAAVDATGSPAGWEAAVAIVRAGGSVNFFGGCAPGTTVPLDTRRTHYDELTLVGSYHHRPATVARAIEILSEPEPALATLLSSDCGLAELETALEQMIERRALKVAVLPNA